MTNQETQEFIDKVKGNKIRWMSWDEGSYFIPDGSISHNSDGDYELFYGDEYKNDKFIWHRRYSIYEGFNEKRVDHFRWEFVIEKVKVLKGTEATIKLGGIVVGTFKNPSFDVKAKEDLRNECICDFKSVVMVTGCQCGGA